MEYKIIKKDKVTSTNDILKNNAEKYEDKTVLVAREQTAGKGRMGRSFYSPPTGLYFSVLLKDIKSNPTSLTIIAAVAVMKGIYETFGISAQVKWVNDIILGSKKICGILAEGVFSGSRISHAVVGIGINISTKEFPDEIKDIAGSLEKDSNNSDILLHNILKNFDEEINNSDSKSYLDFYKKNCLTLNKKVRLLVNDNSYEEGFAFDIDDNANLLVKKESGETIKVFFGEAKVI